MHRHASLRDCSESRRCLQNNLSKTIKTATRTNHTRVTKVPQIYIYTHKQDLGTCNKKKHHYQLAQIANRRFRPAAEVPQAGQQSLPQQTGKGVVSSGQEEKAPLVSHRSTPQAATNDTDMDSLLNSNCTKETCSSLLCPVLVTPGGGVLLWILTQLRKSHLEPQS